MFSHPLEHMQFLGQVLENMQRRDAANRVPGVTPTVVDTVGNDENILQARNHGITITPAEVRRSCLELNVLFSWMHCTIQQFKKSEVREKTSDVTGTSCGQHTK